MPLIMREATGHLAAHPGIGISEIFIHKRWINREDTFRRQKCIEGSFRNHPHPHDNLALLTLAATISHN
jgi:hypothetical protein